MFAPATFVDTHFSGPGTPTVFVGSERHVVGGVGTEIDVAVQVQTFELVFVAQEQIRLGADRLFGNCAVERLTVAPVLFQQPVAGLLGNSAVGNQNQCRNAPEKIDKYCTEFLAEPHRFPRSDGLSIQRCYPEAVKLSTEALFRPKFGTLTKTKNPSAVPAGFFEFHRQVRLRPEHLWQYRQSHRRLRARARPDQPELYGRLRSRQATGR